MPDIHGFVDPGFEGVRTAFETNFRDHGERGAALAVFARGEAVVDLWGGARDGSGAPWREDTAALWMSTTKGITATLALMLVDEGLLDVSARVADYWPGFAQAGKQDITVEQVLSHTCGLVALDPPYLTLQDVRTWQPLVAAMECQEPTWPPGTRHGYHAITFGFLIDELCRRITGSTVSELLQARIAGPLGLDLWIGLPPNFEDRVADMIASSTPSEDPRVLRMDADLADPESLLLRSMTNPIHGDDPLNIFNRPEFHQVALPSANAIGTATAMASMYAGVVSGLDGRRLLSAETLAESTRPRSKGPDACLHIDTSWGLGYGLKSELFRFPTASCFGHCGTGGSVAFGDAATEVAFAYLPTSMQRNLSDPRPELLINAVYEAL